MKKLFKSLSLISIVLIFQMTSIKAQINVVPDGGFEDTTFDWQNYSGEGTLKDWHQINKNPYINIFGLMGLFRTLDTIATKLPYSGLLKQMPKNGNNSVLFLNYVDRKVYYVTYYYKCIFKSKLTQKLTAGKTYCATMYVTADEHLDRYYTNGMSMYFDNGQLDTMLTIHHDSSATFSSVTPQVQCSFIINDTINWMKIQSTFVANGTEEYITIMNPIPDSLLQKQTPIPGDSMCLHSQYVLLDDVSLIPIDLHNWLHDTFCAVGDSVWVGLDWRDYTDGVWYAYNNTAIDFVKGGIDTTAGFWYKPTSAITQFVQGVEICGVWVYDTMNVYAYPLMNNEYLIMNNGMQVYPNPTTETFTVQKVSGNKVQLINMYGQVVQQQIVLNGQAVFNVGALARGVYYIKSEQQVGKVVLE
jgi:hypothetical protein